MNHPHLRRHGQLEEPEPADADAVVAAQKRRVDLAVQEIEALDQRLDLGGATDRSEVLQKNDGVSALEDGLPELVVQVSVHLAAQLEGRRQAQGGDMQIKN